MFATIASPTSPPPGVGRPEAACRPAPRGPHSPACARRQFTVLASHNVEGMEGLRPARLLVPLVVGVEDTEVTTGGAEVEAWG